VEKLLKQTDTKRGSSNLCFQVLPQRIISKWTEMEWEISIPTDLQQVKHTEAE